MKSKLDISGSITEKNLFEAFCEESVAKNKYLLYASKAKKEGFVAISKILEDVAHNEKEHSEIWFKLLNGGEIPETIPNLEDCLKGEIFERSDMYLRFSKEAQEEGFEDIAKLFEGVARIEHEHEKKFEALIKQLKTGMEFEDVEEVCWTCLNCGHPHFGKSAPLECPICSHGRGYFTRSVLK